MKALLFLAVAAIGLALSSCNTCIGIGRDIWQLGNPGAQNSSFQ